MSQAALLQMAIWEETFQGRLAQEDSQAAAPRLQPNMDEAAFYTFYEKTARGLRAYICRVSGDATLAEDLLQEAYCRFLHAPNLRPDDALLKAYLYKIATNLITDHWRKIKRERRWVDHGACAEDLERLAARAPHSGTSAGAVPAGDVRRSFETLKPLERSLLWLAYVEGADHRGIASALGLKEKSIRVMLFRARQKLAQTLKRRGLGPGEKR